MDFICSRHNNNCMRRCEAHTLYIATNLSTLYIATNLSTLYIATNLSTLYIATNLSVENLGCDIEGEVWKAMYAVFHYLCNQHCTN